jgi:3-hydroxyisobutyrate dehydrogenase-like beta-hydroxyacid dehydrogenase
MADRRFQPVQGDVPTLQHYFGMIDDLAKSLGVATPLLDAVVPLYARFMDMGLGDQDVAAMVDAIGSLPRAKPTESQGE